MNVSSELCIAQYVDISPLYYINGHVIVRYADTGIDIS